MPKALITVLTTSLLMFGLHGCGKDQVTTGSGTGMPPVLHLAKAAKTGHAQSYLEEGYILENGKVLVCHFPCGQEEGHFIEVGVPGALAHTGHNPGKGIGNKSAQHHTERDYAVLASEAASVDSSGPCSEVQETEEPLPPLPPIGSEGGEEGGSGSGGSGTGGTGGGETGGTGGTGGSNNNL